MRCQPAFSTHPSARGQIGIVSVSWHLASPPGLSGLILGIPPNQALAVLRASKLLRPPNQVSGSVPLVGSLRYRLTVPVANPWRLVQLAATP